VSICPGVVRSGTSPGGLFCPRVSLRYCFTLLIKDQAPRSLHDLIRLLDREHQEAESGSRPGLVCWSRTVAVVCRVPPASRTAHNRAPPRGSSAASCSRALSGGFSSLPGQSDGAPPTRHRRAGKCADASNHRLNHTRQSSHGAISVLQPGLNVRTQLRIRGCVIWMQLHIEEPDLELLDRVLVPLRRRPGSLKRVQSDASVFGVQRSRLVTFSAPVSRWGVRSWPPRRQR
jgi:hypothetical protein